MSKRLQAILITLAILIGIAIVLNWEYVIKRTRYTITNNKSSEQVVDDKITAQPNRVKIPSLEIDAPLQYVDEKRESVFQTALEKGVVHYPGTALPGQSGNVYIFGHSSDLPWSKGEYKTVFALLPQIKIGAEIIVADQGGVEYKYRSVATKVVTPSDLSVLSQDTGGKKILSLQTSYPVGTALKRFVVIAELVE